MQLPEDIAKNGQFYSTLSNGQLHLKTKHNYFYQIQGQMAITELPYCDFVIWTKKGFSVQRINFDRVFWDIMFEKLKHFYTYSMVPELITKTLWKKLKKAKDSEAQNTIAK